MDDTLFKRLPERLNSPFPTSLNLGRSPPTTAPFHLMRPAVTLSAERSGFAQRRPTGCMGA